MLRRADRQTFTDISKGLMDCTFRRSPRKFWLLELVSGDTSGDTTLFLNVDEYLPVGKV